MNGNDSGKLGVWKLVWIRSNLFSGNVDSICSIKNVIFRMLLNYNYMVEDVNEINGNKMVKLCF